MNKEYFEDKDKVLLVDVDLGNEKDCQCVTLNLYYNATNHIIYQTTDKEQVAVFNEIMEEIKKAIDELKKVGFIHGANSKVRALIILNEMVIL